MTQAFGSVLARNNVDLITIRDFYGHANLSTTNRCLHSKLDVDAVAAMNVAHGVETQPGACPASAATGLRPGPAACDGALR